MKFNVIMTVFSAIRNFLGLRGVTLVCLGRGCSYKCCINIGITTISLTPPCSENISLPIQTPHGIWAMNNLHIIIYCRFILIFNKYGALYLMESKSTSMENCEFTNCEFTNCADNLRSNNHREQLDWEKYIHYLKVSFSKGPDYKSGKDAG